MGVLRLKEMPASAASAERTDPTAGFQNTEVKTQRPRERDFAFMRDATLVGGSWSKRESRRGLFHFTMKRRGFSLLFLALGAVALAGEPAEFGGFVEESKPRVDDPIQERRMTSVDWEGIERPKEVPKPITKSRKIRVVLDAGHGGKDLGAIGVFGLREKTLSLKIAIQVKSRLEKIFRESKLPHEVILTRGRDTYLTLGDRVRLANDQGADLFVSIHGNHSDFSYVKGFEVYFLSASASDARAKNLATIENAETIDEGVRSDVLSILSDVQATYHVASSSRFAEMMFRAMSRKLHANGRGVRQAPFTVLAGTRMPSLLLEVGFLSSPQESKLLTSAPYLKRLVDAISFGIMQFAATLPDIG